MYAIKTIGLKKVMQFFFYGVYGQFLNCLLLPQFRVFFLRIAGAHIGKDTIIYDGRFTNAYHYGYSKIYIQDRCFIGEEVMIDCRGGIVMGANVTVSNRVSLITHITVGYPNHPLAKLYPTKEKKIVIDDGAYIGTGAIILPGVHVGAYSLIAAGSVVTKDVVTKTVVAGVPARVIKRIKKRLRD